MQKQVAPVHFEDFSGEQFERLCFAFLLRGMDFVSVNWFGQAGGDRGRDIVTTDAAGKVFVFQCANYGRLVLAKVQKDLKKIAAQPPPHLTGFRVIAGGKVSADLKEKIATAAKAELGLYGTEVWSGPEFEEHLRMRGPDLLARFVHGEPFPELPEHIRSFARASTATADQDIVTVLLRCLDRPAFRTPFNHESSLPRFKQALAETIEAFNTGKLPSGATIPSRFAVKDETTRDTLAQLVESVAALRATFDALLRTQAIRPCGCSQPDCPTFMLDGEAVRVMDDKRRKILETARTLDASFPSRFYAID